MLEFTLHNHDNDKRFEATCFDFDCTMQTLHAH